MANHADTIAPSSNSIGKRQQCKVFAKCRGMRIRLMLLVLTLGSEFYIGQATQSRAGMRTQLKLFNQALEPDDPTETSDSSGILASLKGFGKTILGMGSTGDDNEDEVVDQLKSAWASAEGGSPMEGMLSLANVISTRGKSEECKSILLSCANTRSPVGCFELIRMCAVEAISGETVVPELKPLGDFDVNAALYKISREAGFSTAEALTKRLMADCGDYAPPRISTLLKQLIPFKSAETPVHRLLCMILTGQLPGGIVRGVRAPFECSYETSSSRCGMEGASMPLDAYFSKYFDILSQGGRAASSPPGWTLFSLIRGVPGARASGGMTLNTCMKNSDDRFECTAAGLLALACENSCYSANCVINDFTSMSACSDPGLKSSVLQSSTSECGFFLQKMQLTAAIPPCSTFSGESVAGNALRWGVILTVLIGMCFLQKS